MWGFCWASAAHVAALGGRARAAAAVAAGGVRARRHVQRRRRAQIAVPHWIQGAWKRDNTMLIKCQY